MNPDGSLTPFHKRELRENLTLLRQAVRRRWDVPAETMHKMLLDTVELAGKSDSTRDKIRASELIRAMHNDDIKSLELMDKIERLEANVATEKVSNRIEVVYVNRLPTTNDDDG